MMLVTFWFHFSQYWFSSASQWPLVIFLSAYRDQFLLHSRIAQVVVLLFEFAMVCNVKY